MLSLSWIRRLFTESTPQRRPARRCRPTLLCLEDRTTPTVGVGFAAGIGGPSFDTGAAIATDSSGNYYVAGTFDTTATFAPGVTLTSRGIVDAFVAKYSPNGALVWAKNAGGNDNDSATGVAVDSAGNVVVTGQFRNTATFDATHTLTSNGDIDAFVWKLNSAGTTVWADQLGGTGADFGHGVAVDGAGNVYATGSFQGTVDADPGAGTTTFTSAGVDDVWIWKLNPSGGLIWAKQLGGTSSDVGNSIAVDSAGNVLTIGSFVATADFDPGAATANLTSAGNSDVFISKLNSAGNFVWAKQFGGTTDDIGTAIAIDGSDNVLTTGYFTGTADFDPSATTANLTSAGGSDAFVSKLDSAGNYIWADRLGGASTDVGEGIALDYLGNVYTTGKFTGVADFNPGTTTFNLSSAGGFDSYVSKLSSSGAFVFAKGLGGTSDDIVSGIALNSDTDVFTTGTFSGTADFDPSSGTAANVTSAGLTDAFMSKLAARPDIVGRSSSGAWTIGPNNTISLTFGPYGQWNEAAGWRDVLKGDFNGDGLLDVASRTSSGQWWLGEGSPTGFINAQWSQWNEAAGWTSVMTGDFNHDGKLDVIGRATGGVATGGGQWWVGVNNPNAAVGTRFNFGTVPWVTWSNAVSWVYATAVDLDGDGWTDLLGRTNSGQWWASINNHQGSFNNVLWASWNEAAGWNDVSAGDFNGDGKVDVIGRTTGGQWWVGINNPSAASGSRFVFTNWTTWASNADAGWHDIVFGDFNGDGRRDIAGRDAGGNWWVALNTGNSTFSTSLWVNWNEAAMWTNVMAVDFDGDGRTDIIGLTSGGQWWVAHSNTNGTSFTNMLLGAWDPTLGYHDVRAGSFLS